MRRVASLALGLALLAGCGDADPPGNDVVDYDGGVLRVDGQDYRPEPDPEDKIYPILPGRVVVQPRRVPGAEAMALAWVERYGLTLEGRSAEGWLLVKVPEGYERQWASAFSMANPANVSATIDLKFSPTAALPSDAPATSSTGAPVPDAEPSAADVRRLAFETYQRLEDAGGLPVTLTATDTPGLIRAKLFDARKESCRRLPQTAPGHWECTADLQLALCNGDCDPSRERPLPKSERIFIRWDAAGRWVLD
ncbi:hypothetical protein PQS31_09830 [Luteimonas sp BLCC-B24]|uniref:hypothetical protein n=1 Tax=Luteimonas sp. BLCC-B24 TaxID=3025317 RepID=UPI00234E0B72|nr:hypothetical protein [Luteimonas sp. BLCC-B24]MDC7807119.1 hypothetical protein [Luteimonas sp. BLCC-B24]